MYYDRSVFSGAGLALAPSNWSALVADQPLITTVDSRKNVTKSIVALGEFNNIKNAKEIFAAMLLQAGNPIVTTKADGTYQSVLGESLGYSPDPVTAATTFFSQFSDPLKTTYSWNRSLPMDTDSFVTGTLATYFGFASELPQLQDKNPHLDFDAAIFPQKDAQGITYGKVYGLALAKSSAKLAAAWPVLQALASEQFSLPLAKALNIIPARRALAAVKQADPISQVFYKSAIIAKSFVDPDYAFSKGIFSDLVTKYQSGISDISALSSEADKKLSTMFAQP
jgi:hypothetical protein